MDSFSEYIINYWRKANNIQAAKAMGLHVETIAPWADFADKMVNAAWAANQPMPTSQQIIDEWHKTHAATHYVGTPFGDEGKVLSPGAPSISTLRQEILDVLAKYNL